MIGPAPIGGWKSGHRIGQSRSLLDACGPLAPAYVLEDDGTIECGARHHNLFSAGTQVDPSEAYRAGSCAPADQDPNSAGDQFFERGAAVDPAALVPMIGAPVGTGTVTATHLVDSAGEPLLRLGAASGWLDGTRPCVARDTALAGKRCIPPTSESRYATSLFADPACLDDPVVTTSPCLGPVEFVHDIDGDACGNVFTAIFAAEPYTGTLYIDNAMLGCIEFPPDPQFDYHIASAEIPLTDFPEIVERTE